MSDPENKIPALVFIYPETFSREEIDEDLSDIYAENLDIKIWKKDFGAFAAFEWIIPTAFGAYILKTYFDSFLSEAGKDHYNLLKKSLNKLIKKGKQHKASVIASSLSPNKLSKTYPQSFVISLEFQTINGRHLKLLFDDNLDLDDWQNATDQMLDLLDNNFASYPNDNLTLEIEKLKTKPHRMIYVIIDANTKQLEFRDDSKMLEKYKQTHS